MKMQEKLGLVPPDEWGALMLGRSQFHRDAAHRERDPRVRAWRLLLTWRHWHRYERCLP